MTASSSDHGSPGPMRTRSADTEQGQRRNRERPPDPEPLPHPVVDNHCHLDISDGDWLDTSQAIARAPPAANSTVETAVPAATSRIVWPGRGSSASRVARRQAASRPPDSTVLVRS